MKFATLRRRQIRESREMLLLVGQKMSNAMFNLKQSDRVPEDVRNTCAELQQQWDESKQALSLAIRSGLTKTRRRAGISEGK